MSESVFASFSDKVWRYKFDATIEVDHLVGGIPNDPKVAEGWLKARLGGKDGKDRYLNELVAATMLERGDEDIDSAIASVAGNINGFKRDKGGLVLEGRNLKAMLKESFSVALAGGHLGTGKGIGQTNKGLIGFVAEHVMTPANFVPIMSSDNKQLTEPTGVQQRFVSTFRGQGIAYEEFCQNATLNFQVWSDYDFADAWPTVWVVAEQQGIGSTRSQGFGKFVIVKWDPVTKKRLRKT